MHIFYQSYDRFESKIIKNWIKSGFKFNAGNVQILRFAWKTTLYYANMKGEKVSEKNKINTNQLTMF